MSIRHGVRTPRSATVSWKLGVWLCFFYLTFLAVHTMNLNIASDYQKPHKSKVKSSETMKSILKVTQHLRSRMTRS